MRIDEVIPTHDSEGNPNQLFAGIDGTPQDLPWPVLVVGIVFKEAHDSLAAGHTGRDKTLERVLRRFWWKNASDDVGAWDVGMYFVTGLSLTEQGNDSFVAFTCKLSKMVHVVPMNFGDSSAATVARIYFDTVWRPHGAPMKIVSDPDPRFQDAFWKELMSLMGVNVAMTTPYNPRSDGQAEHTREHFLWGLTGLGPTELPPDWRIHDVFAQHRLKPYVDGAATFASRRQPTIPAAVVVDGQREAHVDRILARRVRISRGKEVEEWKVRWTGYFKAHDSWRTRDKLERGSPLQQLREFEAARLAMEGQVRHAALRRRERRRDTAGPTVAALCSSSSPLLGTPWEEELEDNSTECLPWERREVTSKGETTYATTLAATDARP
eukprot:gene34561-biopygen33383